MRMILTCLVAMICAASAPAYAQTRITPEDFLDRVEGRTGTFVAVPSGRLVGVEQFLSRTQSKWARSDGSCTYGEITISDSTICFRYDDQPDAQHCWFPYLRGDTLMVFSTSWTSTQKAILSDEPVICEDAPVS